VARRPNARSTASRLPPPNQPTNRQTAGARDLEESIGVSLSARRYEVNRLELTLSIGSFAAAVGAMIAGIFGAFSVEKGVEGVGVGQSHGGKGGTVW
jgi:hypothetical protein